MTNLLFFETESLQTTISNLKKMEESSKKKGGKHCGKRKICSLWAFLIFSQTFSKYLYYRPVERANTFPNKPWLLRVCSRRLLKTLWEKEKLLVTSNSSFFPQCFLPVWITFCHLHQNLELSTANSLSLEGSKICRLGKGEIIYAIANVHASNLDRSKILSSCNEL